MTPNPTQEAKVEAARVWTDGEAARRKNAASRAVTLQSVVTHQVAANHLLALLASHAALKEENTALKESADEHANLLEASCRQDEEIERLKVENVNLRTAFDMADESRETFFRQTKVLTEEVKALTAAMVRITQLGVNKHVDNVWSALNRAKIIARAALEGAR